MRPDAVAAPVQDRPPPAPDNRSADGDCRNINTIVEEVVVSALQCH